MNNEFIIINKTALLKRIEELEKEKASNLTQNLVGFANQNEGEIVALKQILSQSTPLIPEIEKAFESGVDSLQDNLIEKLGLRYQTSEVSSTTINSTRGDLRNYISNLKLDI